MSGQDPALLVVEDDPDALLLLQRAFRKVGVRVPLHVVTDGEAAVSYLAGEGSFGDRRAHPLPCIILLDLKLPKRSGLEVLEWKRGQPHLRGIPVIIVTTSEEEGDRQRAAELGARHYNVKLIDTGSLLRLAKKVRRYAGILTGRYRGDPDGDNGNGN
jgi:CheY-like chemotaxis protein